MNPNTDNDPLLDEVEAFLRQRARSRAAFHAMHKNLPAFAQVLERAADHTLVALQCGLLAPETVAALRDALAFAEGCEHTRAEHDHPASPA